MSAAIEWRLMRLDSHEGLGRHRENWARLNEQLMGGHSMLDARFVDALIRHLGGNHVLLATAQRGPDVVAMLLLDPRPRGLGVWRSFQPSQAQIGLWLMPPGLELARLFASLPGYAIELDLLCNDPRFGDLLEHQSKPARALPHALTISVRLRGHFDDYWAQRPRNLIKNMRRYTRRLQAEGSPTRLVICTSPQELPGAVERYAALESRGWKGRLGTAVTASNAQGSFYAEVMCEFGKTAEALVYELWLGEELIASRLVLRHGAIAMILKTAYNEAFERLAPGRILLMRVLEDLFQRMPEGEVEFYTDASPDQLAWSTSQRWINHISLYRHRGIPTIFSALRRGTRGWLRRGKPPMDTQTMVDRSGAVVDTFVHVHELPADALALMNQAEKEHIEFGADWNANLVDTVYAQGTRSHQVRFHVLRRQSRVLAVLPTVVQDGSLGREVSALSNFYTAIYAPALAPDVDAVDLLPMTRALRMSRGTAAAYRFSPMDPQSRSFDVLRRALSLAGLKAHTYFAFGNWYEPVRLSWAEYLKQRSGQVRSTIKRNSKKFAAEGGRIEIVHGGDGLEVALQAYQAVYAKSWKVQEPYPDFIPGLIRLCARRGWLRLGLAWLGERPVAAQIWIVANGRADIYKLAYDEAYKALAPGTLLTAALMEQAIDVDKVHEIDYLIGDDPYKATWMSCRRERCGLVAYDPYTLRGLLGLARQLVGEGLRRMRPRASKRPDNLID